MSTPAHQAATERSQASKPGRDHRFAQLGIDLAAHYPGPLILLDRRGNAEALNKIGAPLAEALGGTRQPQIIALLARAAEAGAAETDFVHLGEGQRTIIIELTVIPLAGKNEFVVLGRDATLDRNLREALIESRQRFKDLVECSSDFVWETDGDGRFVFVSARGALSYKPDGLIGNKARSLLDRRRPPPEPFPFESAEPVDTVEVWLRDAMGNPACLLVSSIPLVDEGGQWFGARGVCRDVTEERRRDAALSRARTREALLADIVKTIRDEVEPDKLLNTAAHALSEGLGAAACWIWRTDATGGLYRAASFGSSPIEPDAAALADVEDHLVDLEGGGPDEPVGLIACPARYQDHRNGVVCIARTDRRGLAREDRRLMAGVADQLGIAIQQISAQEELLALSRTDSLTGLNNRRAFVEHLGARITALEKSAQFGALCYVDLDNFKSVNDLHGHQQGDRALQALAEILRECARDNGIVARLGGDEFALWCGPVSEDAARAKAAEIVEASRALAKFSEGAGPVLSVSVGVAVYDPHAGETVDALFSRADQAMYAAKGGGKGTYELAPPVQSVPESARAGV